jgi:hypothetical protein
MTCLPIALILLQLANEKHSLLDEFYEKGRKFSRKTEPPCFGERSGEIKPLDCFLKLFGSGHAMVEWETFIAALMKGGYFPLRLFIRLPHIAIASRNPI